MISRRAFLTLPAVAAMSACHRGEVVFSRYAFIANQEGGTVAVVDLGVMNVAKHIPIPGSPAQVLAAQTRPAMYVRTPDTNAIHQIDTETLKVVRKLPIPGSPDAMYLPGDEKYLYVLSRAAQSLYAIPLEDAPGSWRIAWRLRFPEVPVDFALAPDNETAAVASASTLRLASLTARGLGAPLGTGSFGQVAFLPNGERLVAAALDRQQISVYRTHNPRLIVNLPVAVRPENLSFNSDGGQLFVTGPGQDVAVILYTYKSIPEVAETVVVGHAPEGMSASGHFMFIASPTSGDVSVLDVDSHRVLVVPVGSGPSSVAITPDDRYALVLNRDSDNVTVLEVDRMVPDRYKSALVAVIQVGSRPVSAAVQPLGRS